MKCRLLSFCSKGRVPAQILAVESYRQRLQARSLCSSVATSMVFLVGFRHLPAALIRVCWHTVFFFSTKRIARWLEKACELYTKWYVDLQMGAFVLLFCSECYTEKCVMNNYFGIGLDAKISLDFNNKRDEHPEKCRWVWLWLTFGHCQK